MRCRIAQCLCDPKRHAILAMAMDVGLDELPDDVAIEGIKAAVHAARTGTGTALGLPRIGATCALCGAPADQWTYEIRWSKEFPSWDAAVEELHRTETEQRITAALRASRNTNN